MPRLPRNRTRTPSYSASSAILSPTTLAAPLARDVDLVGNLGRDLVDRQGREQAEHTVRHPQGHGDQVGVAERWQIREPVQPSPELLKRPGITHLLDLTLLAPDIQERILFVEAVDGVELMSERALRAVAQAGSWKDQRKALEAQATSTAPASST